MPVNVSNYINVSVILSIDLQHIQCLFGMYLMLPGFQIRVEYKHGLSSMTRNFIRTTKMLRVYCRRFLLLSTQLEDHLHRKLPQLYSRTGSKAVRSAQQHLVQISTTAYLHYFSAMICFPSSWELVRRRELAFLIVPSPAPSMTCGLQSLLMTDNLFSGQ